MLFANTQYLSIGSESRYRNVDVDTPDERKKGKGNGFDDILYRMEAREHNHTCPVLRVELGVMQKSENVMTMLMARTFHREQVSSKAPFSRPQYSSIRGCPTS